MELHALAWQVVGAVERDGLGRVGGAVDVLEDDVGDGHLGRAGPDADVVRAVLLVDDDRVRDVVHGHVLVHELGDLGRRLGVLVRLDAQAVGGAHQRATFHLHVLHVLLVLVPPQAPDADAVAGAALDAVDPDRLAAGPDGDAVVADADGGAADGHVLRVPHVDSVRVGAVPRGLHRHLVDQHVLAREDVEVEELAVGQRDAPDLGVRHKVQHQALSSSSPPPPSSSIHCSIHFFAILIFLQLHACMAFQSISSSVHTFEREREREREMERENRMSRAHTLGRTLQL